MGDWFARTFSNISTTQRQTLIAASLGWMLDSFDAMLYVLVMAHIIRDFGITKGTAGLLNTLTLLASGIGGVLFGFLADRVGRKHALMGSILTYSVFTVIGSALHGPVPVFCHACAAAKADARPRTAPTK